VTHEQALKHVSGASWSNCISLHKQQPIRFELFFIQIHGSNNQSLPYARYQYNATQCMIKSFYGHFYHELHQILVTQTALFYDQCYHHPTFNFSQRNSSLKW